MNQIMYAGICFFLCVSILTISYNSAEDRDDSHWDLSESTAYLSADEELRDLRESAALHESFDQEAKVSILVRELKKTHRIKIGSELEQIQSQDFRAWLQSRDRNYLTKNGSLFASELIKMDRLDLFDELLRRKVSLNSPDEFGNTPLFYSIDHGDRSLVRRVLQETIDINHLNKAGESPLHWAVSKGDRSLFVELLKRGANHKIESVSDSVFHRAIVEDRVEIVQELVWRYPQLVYTKDKVGRDALEVARKHASQDSFEFLSDLSRSAKNIVEF